MTAYDGACCPSLIYPRTSALWKGWYAIYPAATKPWKASGGAGRLHVCLVVDSMRYVATPPVPDGRRAICIAKCFMSVNVHSLKRSRGWRCQITPSGIFAVQHSSSRHDGVPTILRAGADASPSEKSGRPITSLLRALRFSRFAQSNLACEPTRPCIPTSQPR